MQWQWCGVMVTDPQYIPMKDSFQVNFKTREVINENDLL